MRHNIGHSKQDSSTSFASKSALPVEGAGRAISPSYPPGSDGPFMIYGNLFETCFQILLSYKFNLFTALCYSVENHIPFSQHSSSSAFG